ncbi:hypothetical protein SESBI_33896 [Sesbania bispinosa]|nr:hypothetical protein SESBI_33896 [Sesbania bispinosa]
MDFITLILHHGGKFLRNEQRVLEYVGGEVDVWDYLECDILNRFVIIDLCKLHKYHHIEHCYWLYPERDLDGGLSEIRKDHDSDIVDMCLASKHNNGEIEVFFEHPVIPDNYVVFSKVVMAEKTGEMASEMEDVSHVEVAGEMEEYRPDDVVVEEALEEGTVSDIGSDSYESAEDSLYRPSPIVSEGDEEDSPVVAEIRSKKKNDVAARSTDKGKNVVADSSNKKGKNVVADSSNKKGKNVVDDSSKRKGKNVVDDSSKRKGKNVDAVTSSRKGKKKVVDSSKRRRAVTSEESSEDDGEVQNNRLKRSYPECICSRCGHPNHNIRNCMNYGVPPKPRGWKPVETTEVPAADGTTTPVNPTTTTENANETQSEIDLSQSQPLSQPSQPQPVHTNQVIITKHSNI